MKQSVRGFLSGTLVVCISLFMLSYALSMALGLSLFYWTDGSANIRSHEFKALPISIFMFLDFAVPVKADGGLIFLVFWSVYAACFALAFNLRNDLIAAVRNAFTKSSRSIFTNWMAFMPIVSSMLLVAIIVLQSLQESQGVATGSISFKDPFTELFELSYAPIAEEISFRLTPLYAFLFIHFLRSGNGLSSMTFKDTLFAFAGSLVYPEIGRRRLGLKTVNEHGLRGLSRLEWAGILITAVAFGLAHFLSGAGWGLGKITTAFLAGLALGMAYMLYGLQAPILLHWFFNYYFTVYEMASNHYAGAFSTLNIAVQYGTFVFGIVGWLVLIGILLWSVMRRLYRTDRSPDISVTYCMQCGHRLPQMSRYCPVCGVDQTSSTFEYPR